MREEESGAVPPPWLAEKGSSKDSSGPSAQRPDEASRATPQLAPDARAIANGMDRKVGTLGASRPLLRCPVPRPKCPSRRHGHRGGRRMPFGGRAGSALSTDVVSTLACRAARLRAAGLVADGTKPEARS